MNKVFLQGNIGKQPERYDSKTGTCIANFSVATKSSRKQGDRWVDETTWHRCVAFGKSAENIIKFFGRGAFITIEGHIQVREWEKDGAKQYATEIIVDRFYFGPKVSQPVQSNQYDNMSTNNFTDDDIPF